MTCDNIDSDATVFAQNCVIFVHCAMFCLQFISVCMYACMHTCMYACMHVCMYVCMHVCMYACVILVCLFYTHPARVFSMLCIVIHVSACCAMSHAA